jgi:hypothetical protein
LRLTSQDRAVQWQLDIDRVTTSIAFWELPRRAFHARSVRAEGVVFALRRRIPKPEITTQRLEGLPQIVGFDPVPVAEEGPEDDLPDWRYRLFTVWLEDVSAGDVRSIWVDRLRLEGDARVAGAFYLKPIRRVLVAPAQLQGQSLVLSEGRSRVANALRASVKVSLGPFDPRGATLRTIGATLDVVAAGAGRLAGLDFLSRAAGLDLSGGTGPLTFDVALQRGRVQPGTAVAVDARDATARAGDLLVHLRKLASTFQVPGKGPSVLRVEARDADIGARDGEGARVGLARLALQSDPPDLTRPVPAATASLDVRAGRIADGGTVAAALGARGIQRGHGAFALHLSGPSSRLRGWVRASLAGAEVHRDGMALRADVAVDAAVRELDPLRGGDLSGTRIRVDDGRLVDRGGEEDAAPGWWARIIAAHARLRLSPGGTGTERVTPAEVIRRAAVDADLIAQCRDARPLVGLFVRRSSLPGFVSGLFSMDRLSVRGSAAIGDRLVALRDVIAEGDGAQIRATYLASGGRKDGAALLTVRGLRVGVGVGDRNGGVHLLGPGDWFAEQQGRLQAEIGAPAPAARARRAAPPSRAARR